MLFKSCTPVASVVHARQRGAYPSRRWVCSGLPLLVLGYACQAHFQSSEPHVASAVQCSLSTLPTADLQRLDLSAYLLANGSPLGLSRPLLFAHVDVAVNLRDGGQSDSTVPGIP